ncbi:MAG TPA: lipase family protein [Candidatus Elarobacter sp.]|jgi:hypothetical protein|nr:lipase family protein [Candidatus Elarobacter sp.]
MTQKRNRLFFGALLFAAAELLLAGCGGGTAIGTSIPVATAPTAGTTSVLSASAATNVPSSRSGNAGAGIPFPSATDPDPFYAQPNPFPRLAHGAILASRSITYKPNGVATSNAAWQIKFVSQDIYGRPIAAVATVVKPTRPAAGVEPLFVDAFPEDALGPQCAPSHWATGSTVDSNEVTEATLPSDALAAGYTLMLPDIEGPFSLYAVGRQEGYIVLDAMTASLRFASLGLNAKTPIGETGYSGGAHAVSWASALQPTYASSLNLVGTASGGTPADILGIMENIDGSSALSVTANEAFFDIIYMSAVGINRGYPDFLTPILNASGVAAAESMENGCIGKNSDGSAGPTGHFSDYVSVTDLYTNPHVTKATALDSEPQPGVYPKSNVFLYQSVTDELIPIAGVDKLVSGWCADGSPVEYYRAANGGDHVTMETQTEPVVFAYLSERFKGLPLTLPLGQTTSCN